MHAPRFNTCYPHTPILACKPAHAPGQLVDVGPVGVGQHGGDEAAVGHGHRHRDVDVLVVGDAIAVSGDGCGGIVT